MVSLRYVCDWIVGKKSQLTDISFRNFFLSTWIGLLPFQIVWTHLGTTLHNLGKISSGEIELSIWQQISMFIQLLMAVLLIGYFYYLSKKINLKETETELYLQSGNLSATTELSNVIIENSSKTVQDATI